MKTNLIIKRILFYIVSFTWGALMSVIGLLALFFTLPFGEFKIYHGRICKRIGRNRYWGGLELGCFFFVSTFDDEYLMMHEAGHGIQNCLFGPLFPIVVGIPSAVRYWYREIKVRKNPGIQLPDYYSIWFEKQASDWGAKYIVTDRI